jgi:glutamate 5-kinase
VGIYIVEKKELFFTKPKKTVIGTSSIVHETTHQPLLSTLSAVVETVVDLKRHGHKVVLVSSGAIGVGLKRMNIESRPKNLSGKQVCVPFFPISFYYNC